MFLFLFVNWTIDHYFGALHLHLTYTCILFSAPLPSLVSSTHAWKSSESWSPCSLWETSRAFTLRCWNLPGSYTKLDSPDLLHHNAVCVCVIKRWLHFRQGLHTHVHLMSGWDNPLWLWPSHAILTLKKHLLPPPLQTHTCMPLTYLVSLNTHSSPHSFLIRDIAARWQVLRTCTCIKVLITGVEDVGNTRKCLRKTGLTDTVINVIKQ